MLALTRGASRPSCISRLYSLANAFNLPSNPGTFVVRITRPYSQERKESSAVGEAKHGTGGEVSTATAFETVKETSKSIVSIGIVLAGLAATGSLLWIVFDEMFSSNTPHGIFSNALEKCIADKRIQDHLGLPIKGYGEETRRRSRRHVSHSIFLRDGRKHMWMQFYVQGSRKKGTVLLEMREDDNGKYQTNVMVVKLDDMFNTSIVVEDNRNLNVGNLPTLSELSPEPILTQ